MSAAARTGSTLKASSAPPEGRRRLLVHRADPGERNGFRSGNARIGLGGRTSATVTFVPGTGIAKIALVVRGTVPGLDADAFRTAAEGAKKNCPVSQALAGVPEITLDAELE